MLADAYQTTLLEDYRMSRLFFLLFLLVAASLQPAYAHDAWFIPKDTELVVAYGHGEKLDPYDPAKVKDPKGYDTKGQPVPVQTVSAKESVSISLKEKPAIVTALFDGGYGVKTNEGWQRLTKREAQGKYTIVEALKSQKYSKALLESCEMCTKHVGLVFEIVPEKDPFSVKPGETLPLRILLNGKALEGAVVKTSDTARSEAKDQLKSDKDGKASAVLGKPGLQLIVASYKTQLKDDPDADILSLGTSLTFETK
jgi:nickel transport protein